MFEKLLVNTAEEASINEIDVDSEKQKLIELGYDLIEIRHNSNVYEEISSHVDIFTFKIGEKLIVEPNQYNNIKIWMDAAKNMTPHVFIRISISEACYSLKDFTKINGGLGYEERFVIKWFGRFGIKEKLTELWSTAEKNKEDNWCNVS